VSVFISIAESCWTGGRERLWQINDRAFHHAFDFAAGKIVAGEILFDGKNLLQLSNAEMRHVRGNDIAMIFQDPMTSLNPSLPWRADCRSAAPASRSFPQSSQGRGDRSNARSFDSRSGAAC